MHGTLSVSCLEMVESTKNGEFPIFTSTHYSTPGESFDEKGLTCVVLSYDKLHPYFHVLLLRVTILS